MILLPLSGKLEKLGMGRFGSTLLVTGTAVLLFLTLFVVISFQVDNLIDNREQVKQALTSKVESIQDKVESTFGIGKKKQLEMMKLPPSLLSENSNAPKSTTQEGKRDTQKESEGIQQSSSQDKVMAAFGKFFSFAGNSLLTFIYLFFILFYRHKIRLSVLAFFGPSQRPRAKEVMKDSLAIAQHYLFGRVVLIFFLWIIYSVGLSISGVDNAILISFIAALLSLLPYVGPILGFAIALIMALVSGGEINQFIGVTVTYGLAQFVESYILEPYIVGDQVNLNPLATILVVVLGGAVWGVTGMVISIPLFGMLKIIADRIPPLQPLGYMLGKEDIAGGSNDFIGSWIEKIKKKIS